jgi:DnaJ like chaperone protein
MVAGMSLWTALSDLVGRLQIPQITGTVGGLVDRIVEAVRSLVTDSEESRQVAFTVSMIALAAKIAKADGVVTRDEVDVVRRLFVVPENERANVARLFNLARQDVAGFEHYAEKLRKLYDDDPVLMEDVLDGLFTIATADGLVHEHEDVFLERVAEIFGIDRSVFLTIHARHVRPDATEPWVVLGVRRGATQDEIKKAWRRLVAENHPDRLVARGVPAECIRLATDRVATINAAYEILQREPVA